MIKMKSVIMDHHKKVHERVIAVIGRCMKESLLLVMGVHKSLLRNAIVNHKRVLYIIIVC